MIWSLKAIGTAPLKISLDNLLQQAFLVASTAGEDETTHVSVWLNLRSSMSTHTRSRTGCDRVVNFSESPFSSRHTCGEHREDQTLGEMTGTEWKVSLPAQPKTFNIEICAMMGGGLGTSKALQEDCKCIRRKSPTYHASWHSRRDRRYDLAYACTMPTVRRFPFVQNAGNGEHSLLTHAPHFCASDWTFSMYPKGS